MVLMVHCYLTPLYSLLCLVPLLTQLLVHLGTHSITRLGSSMSIEGVVVPLPLHGSRTIGGYRFPKVKDVDLCLLQ